MNAPLRIRTVLTTSLLIGLASCTDSSGPPPQPVVTPVDAATATTARVSVRFDGEAPAPTEINMRAAGACAELHPEPVYDRPVDNPGGKLANALVYVKSGLEGRVFPYPTQAVTIDQRGCLYQPRVAALMVGQELRFLNSDPEAHNVRGRPSEVRAWNFMMSRPQSTRSLRFDKPEIGIRVGCDVHPWMSAFVSVLPHPYFGVTGSDGTVELNNLPPGDYTIAAWHETLGEKVVSITLAAKEEKAVVIAY